MAKLIVVSGAPGFGKSFYTRSLPSTAIICSADHYMMVGDKYEFHKRKLGFAHKSCKDKAFAAIKAGSPLVVIDNTNITYRDFKDYVDAAKAAGYEIEIVRLDCPVDVAIARGTHNVPADVVQRMAKDLASRKLPDDLKETVIKTE